MVMAGFCARCGVTRKCSEAPPIFFHYRRLVLAHKCTADVALELIQQRLGSRLRRGSGGGAKTCLPPSADLTRHSTLPSRRRLLLPSFPPSRLPFSPSDKAATVARTRISKIRLVSL